MDITFLTDRGIARALKSRYRKVNSIVRIQYHSNKLVNLTRQSIDTLSRDFIPVYNRTVLLAVHANNREIPALQFLLPTEQGLSAFSQSPIPQRNSKYNTLTFKS